MVATILVAMLCAHLLCFAVMFMLISRRLPDNKMGMDYFAAGNLLLAVAYVLQLLEGRPAWTVMSVTNHTLTLAAPVTYWLGAMRFFGRPVRLWQPLLGFTLGYGLLQVLVQWQLGVEARYALLAGMSALLFFIMSLTVIYGVRTFAKNLNVEMLFFAMLIGGICVLNGMKFFRILDEGLEALSMDSHFQMMFYIYMSTLATIVPPSIVWLVLRQLTDDLRNMAACDPMTSLYNRRGLLEALQQHFAVRNAAPACLLLMDVDHFKKINDSYGHQMGDKVICCVADALRATLRGGDFIGRIGGEEFVGVCVGADEEGVRQLAERLRLCIEKQMIPIVGEGERTLQYTVTIGISSCFYGVGGFDEALRQADMALYKGKAAGRNRIEWVELPTAGVLVGA